LGDFDVVLFGTVVVPLGKRKGSFGTTRRKFLDVF
jgi:hypothetical protein